MRIPSMNYLRHRTFARVRRSKKLIEFLAAQDTRLTSSASATTVDSVDVAAIAAVGTLTFGANALNNSTVTLDARVYTYKDTLTGAANEILVGASASASLDNLISAVNGTAGAGTTYGTGTVAHATVDAAAGAGDTATMTATTAGTAGNSIATTTTVVSASFGGNSLVGGAAATFGPTFAATTHGITDGEGPYVMTSSNGAGGLPAGIAAGELLYVANVSASVLGLARTREEAIARDYIQITSAGTGTLTITKAMTNAGIFGILRRHKARTVVAAADIDSLN